MLANNYRRARAHEVTRYGSSSGRQRNLSTTTRSQGAKVGHKWRLAFAASESEAVTANSVKIVFALTRFAIEGKMAAVVSGSKETSSHLVGQAMQG